MPFDLLLKKYRFYEALAIYDLYYERTADAVRHRYEQRLALADDRPIAWVPLIFHGTTFEALSGIIQEGSLRPAGGKSYVCFTELPIDNLDRLRTLGPRVSEVAIGFPRPVLESAGLYQPAYLKHSPPEVKAAFARLPDGYVELEDDLGALHEVRVPEPVNISEAVWLLSSERNEVTKSLDHPLLKTCQETLGMALSFWHPTHQREMIQEHVYRQVTRDTEERLETFASRGVHYAMEDAPRVERRVILPAGRSPLLAFPTLPHSNGWDGPFTKYEMASFLHAELKRSFPKLLSTIRVHIEMD